MKQLEVGGSEVHYHFGVGNMGHPRRLGPLRASLATQSRDDIIGLLYFNIA
jgi:hypothetical protein